MKFFIISVTPVWENTIILLKSGGSDCSHGQDRGFFAANLYQKHMVPYLYKGSAPLMIL